MKTLYHALNKDHWKIANRRLIKKILTEFLYEEMLQTKILKMDHNIYLHQLIVHDTLYYEFKASPRIFNQWHIDEESITLSLNNQKTSEIYVSDFIRDIYRIVGIDGLTLGHFLRELNNTLIADCHLLSHTKLSAKDLLNIPNYQLECLLQGHPWFVINKGRLGFSYDDYLNYSPEQYKPLFLSWIAIKKDQALFNAISSLSYDKLIASEISLIDRNKFNAILEEQGVSSDHYYFMPIHEWQWQHQIIQLFAHDIVEKNMIYLGKSSDTYLPTQSIRTFVNTSHLSKHQVKLPLSIFNTAVYRGLPGDRTQLAPLLTDWLKEKLAGDILFSTKYRLILLGEIASVDVPHRDFQHLSGIPYQYKELLGVIWRESIHNYLEEGEKGVTMAALIHKDHENHSFIQALISASGLNTEDWLNEFFSVTISPLLHWLYRYGLVFSPHGENTMLILKNYRPKSLVIKDFIDDINISETSLPELKDLPKSLKDILLHVSDTQITQFIHTGLFVVLYRYLSDILATDFQYSEGQFWKQVYDVIIDYQKSHPELKERFKKFDLLKKSFDKMCLNRLRVLSVGYKDYDDRPKVDTLNPMSNPVSPDIFQQWL